MCYESVSLHFSEPNAAALLPALDRLQRDRIDGAGGAHLEFVGDHVSQPLVVDDAEEDLYLY